MPYKIFISHYSEERIIAEAIQRVLRQAYVGHAEVFISFDIPKGTDWLKRVKAQLTEADEILTVFTHKSADRPWLNIETGYGIMCDLPVTPVLCRGFQVNDLSIVYRLQEAVTWDNRTDVDRLFDDILSRIRRAAPLAEARWDQQEFWSHWKGEIGSVLPRVPVSASRMNPRPAVWLMGSHRHLPTEDQQQRALDTCKVIARACLEHHIQIVMGTSRMLEYLVDQYENIADAYEKLGNEPDRLAKAPGELFRKTIASEQAQTVAHTPNPVVLLGSLRSRGIREVFDDAIGRIPDIAILIGGREASSSGRAADEFQHAIDAGIPFLPLKFTGGAAANAPHTIHSSLENKVAELQTLTGNQDRLRVLIAEIIEEQAALNGAT